MAKLKDIRNYQVSPMDSFFFDNNIWVFLFAPIASSNERKQNAYASFLSRVQSANAMIFTTSMVISEFANFCLRLSFRQWKDREPRGEVDYKRDYIPTQDYKEAAEDVKDSIKEILKISERRPDDYNAINLDKILSNIHVADFNDNYYAELCTKNNLKIVTDDKDFAKLDNKYLEVISLL